MILGHRCGDGFPFSLLVCISFYVLLMPAFFLAWLQGWCVRSEHYSLSPCRRVVTHLFYFVPRRVVLSPEFCLVINRRLFFVDVPPFARTHLNILNLAGCFDYAAAAFTGSTFEPPPLPCSM